MKTLRKAAAIFGSAAALIAFSAGAMHAFAFEQVDLRDRTEEIKSGVTNLVADEVYAEAGETVSYRVSVTNNAGYANCGFALNFDPKLGVVKEENGKPELKAGDGSYGLTNSYSVNDEKSIIGFATMGTDNCTKNEAIYTVKFIVPDQAKEGDTYPLTLTVEKFLDSKTKPVEYNTVAGWIKVRAVTTTAATTTQTEKATTTTSTTAKEVTESNTKPSEGTTTVQTTVTTDITTDISTVSNTSKTNRNQDDVTTASRPTGTTATGKSQASSSTTTSVKTGDTGVGVALAALMLAGATAFVCKRKKED